VDADAETSFLDALRILVDANLVRMADRGAAEARVELLETIREYGCDRLAASGEQIAMETRHALYYLDLAETAEPELRGPDQVRWLDRLEAEHDNLRASLHWALAESAGLLSLPLTDAMHPGDQVSRRTLGLRLGSALGQFWFRRGHLEEGQRWLVALLGVVPDGGEPAWSTLRARVLKALGLLTFHYSEPERALAFFGEALALDEASGNVRARAESLLHVGSWPSGPERIARSATFLPAALRLWQELGDTQGVAETLMQLGYLAQVRAEEERRTTSEDRSRARAYYEQSLALFRDTGDLWNVADTLWLLGQVVEPTDDVRAEALYEESLAVSRAIGSKRGIGIALGLLAGLAERRGDLARAIALHEESLPLRRAAGDRFGLATSLAGLAHAAHLRGDYARAARLLEETRALWQAMDYQGWAAIADLYQGDVAYREGRAVEAIARFGEALTVMRTLDWRWPWGEAAALACLAVVAWRTGDRAGARSAAAECLVILDGLGPGDAGAQEWADASGTVLLILTFTYLGDLALAEGDALLAAARYGRGLARAAGPLDGVPVIAHDLVIALAEGLGIALVATEQDRAAALLAACAAWRGEHGVALPVIRRPAVDQALQTLRRSLDATAFGTAWAQGSEWSVEQVLRSAACHTVAVR
jgi:tetratricopeptide (TPR) repeat protein